MKAPGLYSAFTGSIFLHVLLIAASIIAVRHSNFKRVPASYIVSLVSAPPASSISSSKEADNGSQKTDAVAKPEKMRQVKQTMHPLTAKKQKNNTKKEDDRLVNDRIAALQAKKQIEKSAALRKILEVESTKQAEGRSLPSRAGHSVAHKANASGPNGGGDYDSRVTEKIRQQWLFPESIDRDLEAIVSIRVARDGSITIQKVEKSSGSPLFDRTVLRAIAKAGPLPQPPKEMEIVVRFRP